MNNPTNSQLPRGSIGFCLGIAGMLVSLYYSIMFISGSATGAELLIGVIFALTLDYGKVALATEAMIAMIQLRLFSAVIYSLIVICLYCLSMLAATFMLTSHNTSAIAVQSDLKIATIEQSITAKRAELAKCPAGIMTKCITPRTAELNALQAELTAAQNVSSDVIAAKNQAATWDKISKMLGTPAEELQVKLAFARAFLLEIIAPIFVSLFLSTYRNRLQATQSQERVINSPEPITAEQQPPQMLPMQTTPQLPSYKFSGLKW